MERLTRKEFKKADTRIRRSFGLESTTSVVLPHGPSRTWLVELGGLREEQVMVVLRAAVDAEIPMDQPWQARLSADKE